MKILLLDNFDSFTFNLLHYLQIAGAEVTVKRNHETGIVAEFAEKYDAAVLSPGPGTPDTSGCLMEFVHTYCGRKPILGVCLGMQAIGMHYGWSLLHAEIPRHGKASMIQHSGQGIFSGIHSPMQAGRYHSLIISGDNMQNGLRIEAVCGEEIMAVSADDGMVWGVQFHPESILTPDGQTLISNWVTGAERRIRSVT